MNMNCSRDHSSERKQKILPWITMIIGLTLTTFVVILLTQLINLSRNVDVSRRTLSEMSGRLQKIQKENDEMKKELRNTKSNMERILRKFPSPQKVSAQVRRTTRAQGAGRNLRPQNNITTKCACEPTAAYIHVNTIDPGWMYTHWARDQDTLKIAWRYYSPSCLASLPNRFYIQIARKGTYGVYCNLRMKTPFIKEVAVWSHHGHHQGKTKYLFNYTLPYNSTNSTKPFHDVRFFKLVSLRKRSKLYAHLKLDIPDSWKEDIRALKFKNFLLNLFDNEVNNNNFGVFSIQ